MTRHWGQQGQIPIAAVRNLTQQMWQAGSFLHKMSYVHRDVKPDNFMMDLPQVENPANRIYLGDLGSAIELKPGARLSCPKGTDQFFSPEVYRHNYAHKV